ncbi:hypothetical protein [Pseudomonas sp. GZD-209]|uniref:hypothetical protein n=1 Tax=Pseudomonas sp. GZD-209 TaxID=3404807 RepID=UPI003BB4C2A3
MAALIGGGTSALDVHLNGTIGTFKVSKEDGSTAGIEVRYLLTHVTLSEKVGQAKLLSMLAPVREVFDLQQLGFDEIMQRDIEDSRVSLELIPYLLDTSTSGLIKLFPPIVAVALPLKPNSRVPASNYRKVTNRTTESSEHSGIQEHRITAGEKGEEQFEFFQHYRGDTPLSEGAQLRLAKDNCTLAIVDGQHRAMALLALYRNLTGGWADANRSPYEGYYKVWPDKEIRSYDLSSLQLPVLICTFPELDASSEKDIDVVRAARRVFLTLNKTAKSVSDSRNKLLNDQDIVAECLRATLSYIKDLDVKDDTALRIWNVELDQERDRVKIASDVAFTGVSHLYHLADHLLMGHHVHGIEARGKVGAPKKKLDTAYDRLGLKDELTQEQRDVNNKFNYSDEIKVVFRETWSRLYTPIIDKLFALVNPFSAFGRATIKLNQELRAGRDTELEKMLFDGQATVRIFDDFREGLARRVGDNEQDWNTPEIKETLIRVNGVLSSRKEKVENMKADRAAYFLAALATSSQKKVILDGKVAKPLREFIDKLFDNVFTTVAFQTAVVCTYLEMVERAYSGVSDSTDELLLEYIDSLNSLFSPKTGEGLKSLVGVFEGDLRMDGEIAIAAGGPTFRKVVLPGELQPAEWPKYRYLILEIWKTKKPELSRLIEMDKKACRASVAQALVKRLVADYCKEHRITDVELSEVTRKELQERARVNYEEFLQFFDGKKFSLDSDLFAPTVAADEDFEDEDLD